MVVGGAAIDSKLMRVAALLWAVAAALHCAQADEVAAFYQAYWAGMPAGEIRLTLRDDPAAYHDEIAIRRGAVCRQILDLADDARRLARELDLR